MADSADRDRVQRLRSAAGAAAVLPSDANARFAVRGRLPSAVVAPDTADAAAAVLGLCTEQGWSVECAGAGTWLHHGRTPDRVDVVISTQRLDGVSEYEPADLTLGVRAGTPLARVHEETARHRQHAPFAPPVEAGATIGATLATGAAGPLSAGEGTPRDHALGIEVVTGDGRVLRFGGRVVKNVAGYDAVRLLVGSHGTLGLITAAHLRLQALPAADITLAVTADTPEPLLDAVAGVAAVDPAALELLHGEVSADDGWTLRVRLRGGAEAVAEDTRRVRAAFDRLATVEPAAAAADWARLAALEAQAVPLIRLRGRPTELAATLAAARDLAAAVGRPVRWSLAAHATTGVVRLLGRADGGPDGFAADACARLAEGVAATRTRIAPAGGTVNVAVPPTGMPAAFQPYAIDPALRPLTERLKAAFDPAGILAPGRFVL